MPRPVPKIRTVLFGLSVLILLLPLAGIQALKLYENELIRQTEAALIGEALFLREHAREQILARLAAAGRDAATAGVGAFVAAGSPEPYEPVQARLDLGRDPILPRGEDARETSLLPDPAALAAGESVTRLIERARRHSLAGYRVVDHQGLVVASSGGELGRSLLHREEIQRALLGHDVSLLRVRVSDTPKPPLAAISRANLKRVFVALPIRHDGRILGAALLSRTPLELEKALYQNRAVLFRYGAGLLLLVSLVTVFTATTISRPLDALIAQTERVKAGAPSTPLARPGTHEVERLSQAIDAMARALAERAAYIEAFARSVSHEFKTPIASIRGTVELLKDHIDGMSVAERERFLGMLDGEARRMETLVTRLLHLARADVRGPGDAATRLGGVLDQALSDARARGLAVETALAEGAADLAVPMDAEALAAVVGNLLENARQHGGPSVRARLAVTPCDGRVRIAVEDDGPGISAANLPRVFDPFFTTARAAGGTGLGLPIVKAMVEAHGGAVRLQSPGRGVVVTVELPLVGS